MKLKNPLLILSKKERPIHLGIWVLGLILVNVPDWEVDLGVFHSDDFSLVIPSIYGTFLNAYLFYECARQIIQSNFADVTDAILGSLLTLLGITLLEAFLDALYYAIYYWSFDKSTFTKIIFNEVLMDFIFVYLPSMMYAFVKMWHPNEVAVDESPKIFIQDREDRIEINLLELKYVESKGAYCVYHASENYLISQSLEDALKQLPSNFVKCHDEVVVNVDLIKAVLRDEVVVAGFIVPMEGKYREKLLQNAHGNVAGVDE